MTAKRASRVLWGSGDAPDPELLDYTAAADRRRDARLVPWDVLGSLGHVEGLRASGLLDARAHAALVRTLRAALRAADRGRLGVEDGDEDVHTAVESWITRRCGAAGAKLHTGRSRNDQIACDLRLYAKARLLELHEDVARLAGALLDFASRQRRALWPGYTHGRRAMPSSAAAWAAAYADGLLVTLAGWPAVFARVDRSPLGSGAGFGVPLPLDREAAARALGFAAVEHAPAAVQNGRGKLEAAVLAWCAEIAHEVGRLASDVVALASDDTGYLVLPDRLATGSSLMPHKKNPDVFELTRARAALVDGALVATLQIKSKLALGYNRDVQTLKGPLFDGLDELSAILGMMARALPQLQVDRERAEAALDAGTLSTDEVMRRVEAGVPFRRAYRAVAAEIAAGREVSRPSVAAILRRRRSTGGLGNLGLAVLRRRLARERATARPLRRRFTSALQRLRG